MDFFLFPQDPGLFRPQPVFLQIRPQDFSLPVDQVPNNVLRPGQAIAPLFVVFSLFRACTCGQLVGLVNLLSQGLQYQPLGRGQFVIRRGE